MRKVQLFLYLLLWCQTAESLIDKRVKLGENVTLDCQIDVKDMYWVFQKLTDSPVLILRTYSSQFTASLIQEERFRGKYSSLTLSRLFISNITIDELGIYYCIKRDSTIIQLSNGTRLYITESAEDHNQIECNEQQPQVDKPIEIQKVLTATFVLLNIVLIIAIIGLLMFKLQKPRKSRQQRQNFEAVASTNAQEFSEVEFHLHSPTNNTFEKKQNKRNPD